MTEEQLLGWVLLPSRVRRSFPKEFNADAVASGLYEGRSIASVHRALGIGQSNLGNWVRQTRVGRGERKGLTTADRVELARLRRENAQRRMKCDLFKRAAAFWAPSRGGDPAMVSGCSAGGRVPGRVVLLPNACPDHASRPGLRDRASAAQRCRRPKHGAPRAGRPRSGSAIDLVLRCPPVNRRFAHLQLPSQFRGPAAGPDLSQHHLPALRRRRKRRHSRLSTRHHSHGLETQTAGQADWTAHHIPVSCNCR